MKGICSGCGQEKELIDECTLCSDCVRECMDSPLHSVVQPLVQVDIKTIANRYQRV